MKKFTVFLEKYVQWIALGVAVLYVGFMVYTYIVSDPLTEKVGTTTVLPGTIDQEILSKQITPLEREINNHAVNAPAVTDVLKTFDLVMNENNLKVESMLATIAAPSVAPDVLGPDIKSPVVTKVDVPFPLLPAATVKALSTGRTVINVPSGKLDAAGQPVLDAAGQPVMARQDMAYTSILFTLDRAQFAKVANWCTNKDIPPGLFQGPEFTQVELLREELKPDAVSWTPAKVIKGLPINEIPAFPGDDSKPGTEQDFFNYKDWMHNNQELITLPAFYPTAPDAEPWVAPGTTPVDTAAAPGQPLVAERPFDPARDIPKTEDQRRQVAESRRQAALQRRSSNPGGHGRPTPGTGYVPPLPSQLPPPYSPATVTGRPTAFPNGLPPERGMMPPFGAGANGGNPLLQGDPQILVHDTTIEEGKTYRYSLRYKIYNPLFNLPAFAQKAVSQKFALSSPDPATDKAIAWTDKVNVEPSNHVFVTTIASFTTQTTFDVFEWKDGRWHKAATPKLQPGDTIPGTQLTVVDVRKDLRSNLIYIILMDNHGVLQRRELESDKADPQLKKLNDLINSIPGPAASAR